MSPTRSRALIASLSLPMALMLVACGAGTNGDSKSSAGSGGAAGSAPADSLSSDFGSANDAAAKAPASQAAAIQRAVIATGAEQLTSAHLGDARLDAIDLVTGLGGTVANEQSQSDDHGRLRRVDLSLRVPAASFERALDGLARLGTVQHREQSVQDVTTQVIDNDARVRAQEASVESIKRLLRRATTIAEIISIEGQLSTRQADLDSLKQQQKWLADQTSMSTIQLTMTRPSRTVEAGTGFFSGFGRGWHALGRSTVAVGTAVGAVLPFAVVLALLGVPGWLLVRRRKVVAAPAAEA